jgi:poly(3-hydroxybutyrate) depolymerase
MRVFETAVVARPFCTLRAIAREHSGRPAVLIVTPFSGQQAATFGDLIEALAPNYEVYVTDWVAANLVPFAQGDFDLDDMIGCIIDFVRLIGPGAHLIGMSQSGVPVLAAVALMAAVSDPARPRSLTLMGSLIDTRINPTPMNRRARSLLADPGIARRIERRVIRRVPAGMPGAGRLVYPGAVQRAALTSTTADS